MKVYIKTPARLHLGLIDLNGNLGRILGGIGVGIDHPNVIVEAQQAQKTTITGEGTVAAYTFVKRFFDIYPTRTGVHLNVKQTISSHAGLGSGTQLALAIATALAKITNTKASTQELALAMGRIQRTGVGTAIFEKGGFIVDGGKNTKNQTCAAIFPPVIFRQPFPDDWRFVIVVPNTNKGWSSDKETAAFNELPAMSAGEVAKICRLTMMQLLPALAEKDIENFGEALTNIQTVTGEYFAQVQGGTYSDKSATRLLEFMLENGAYGVGQSSWGPTLYGVIKKEQAEQALQKIQPYLQSTTGGQSFIAKANNKGAYIKITEQ